jgi:hypothetical protein
MLQKSLPETIWHIGYPNFWIKLSDLQLLSPLLASCSRVLDVQCSLPTQCDVPLFEVKCAKDFARIETPRPRYCCTWCQLQQLLLQQQQRQQQLLLQQRPVWPALSKAVSAAWSQNQNKSKRCDCSCTTTSTVQVTV